MRGRLALVFLVSTVVLLGQRGGGRGYAAGPRVNRPAYGGGAPTGVFGGGYGYGGNFGGVYGAPRVYGGSPTGFGNILYPGTGSAPPVGSITDPSFALRLGSTISGGLGVGAGFGSPIGPYYPRPGAIVPRGRTVVVPYALPVFVGGYGNYGYTPQEPSYTVVVPQSPSPTVIINQGYVPETARPVVRDYSPSELPDSGSSAVNTYTIPPRAEERPEPREAPSEARAAAPGREAAPVRENQASLILIAYRDGTIYPAVGYMLNGDTISYVSAKGGVNHVSLDLIDTEMTERLNRERGLEVRLRK